jgi:hypothetical protein
MWTSVKWSVHNSSFTCSVRKDDKQKIITFPKNKCILLNLPLSFGDEKDCITSLKDIFSTSQVDNLGTTFYKVIYPDNIEIPKDDTVKDIKVLDSTVSTLLFNNGLQYHQQFDDDNKPSDELTPEDFIPRVCFWNLEFICDGKPNPQINPVYFVATHNNIDDKITIHTFLSNNFIADMSSENIEIISYKSECTMLEALVKEIFKYDLDVGYETSNLHWPYLIERLKVLNSKIFDHFKVVDERRIESDTLDHVDMSTFFKVAYPQFSNYTLDYVSRYLLKKSQPAIDRQDCLKFFNIIEKAPSFQALKLIDNIINTVKLSAMTIKELWNISGPCYSYLVNQTDIPYSLVGSGAEIEAFILRTHPQLLLGLQASIESRLPMPYLDRTISQQNVNIYSLGSFMIQGLKDSEDELGRKFASLLENISSYVWIIKAIFLHPQIETASILNYQNLIGVTKDLVFMTGAMEDEALEAFDYFLPITTGSWIGKNISNDTYTYHGISPQTRHSFPHAKKVIEGYIDQMIEKRGIPADKFVSKFGSFILRDLYITTTITQYNLLEYRDILTEEQMQSIMRGNQVKLSYLRCTEDKIVNELEYKGQKPDLVYYSNELYKLIARIPLF